MDTEETRKKEERIDTIRKQMEEIPAMLDGTLMSRAPGAMTHRSRAPGAMTHRSLHNETNRYAVRGERDSS